MLVQLYSIHKTQENEFFLEDLVEKKVYKFKRFAQVLAAFSSPRGPQFEGCELAQVPENSTKIDILEHTYIKHAIPNAQPLPYYYWLKSGKRVDPSSYLLMNTILESIKEIERW
jgi:hypothetical protein